MLDYEKTKAWRSPDVRHSYKHKDTILYALGLGIGIGADPLDPAQLRFVYERDLLAVPTMAAVLGSPGLWMRDRSELGIDFMRLVHGEQRVVLHAPLPAAGTVIGRSRVLDIVDKGTGKGAVMRVQKELTDEVSGMLLATTEQVLFLRGDGGFSTGSGGDQTVPAQAPTSNTAANTAPNRAPDRAPDVVLDLPTRPDAALLYRLSGDINPLHADPAFAAKAGFPRPILHGLATYGIACHGLVKSLCGYDPARLTAMRARLSSPVFPGETIRLEAWNLESGDGAGDGDGNVAFGARVVERDLLVLTHGRATVRP